MIKKKDTYRAEKLKSGPHNVAKTGCIGTSRAGQLKRQQPQQAGINSCNDLGSQPGVYLDAERQRQHICKAKDGRAHN